MKHKKTNFPFHTPHQNRPRLTKRSTAQEIKECLQHARLGIGRGMEPMQTGTIRDPTLTGLSSCELTRTLYEGYLRKD